AGEPVAASGRTPATDISGAGGLSFGKPNFLERRSYPDEKRTQFVDILTLMTGTHAFKFGGEGNHVHDTLDNLFQEGGVYAYNNRVDFISDYITNTTSSNTPTRFYSSFNQGVGPSAFSFSTDDYAGFVQDTWRVDPQLTVDLGLRYE